MTSVAQQNVAQLGGARSVLSRQKHDHLELHRLLDALGDCRSDQSGPLLVHLYRLVFPHAFAEEAVLWPVIRRVMPNGHELTLKLEREHQVINELVTQMEALPRNSVLWRDALEQAAALLIQDARDEEEDLLPGLQRRLTAAQLRRLGMLWELVRRIAPTRPHPMVSRRPPGNVLSVLPLTLLDRSLDWLDLRRYRRGAGIGPEDRVSAGLTGVAHATERLPGLQLGEDLSTNVGGTPRMGWRSAVLAGAIVGSAVLIGRKRWLLPGQ